ncbi:MAG: hypothetical protein HN719_07935 [Alphaproteobacteria bacterium]|jgi:hypothetical protein|nr:hypothetical protein [Alphaproteobacteria bacterium]
MTTEPTLKANIPLRRYLNREEAAAWIGVSVDTFMNFGITYSDLGPRCKRWDIVDIQDYLNDNKSCDSARTSDTKRRRQSCDSTNAKIHQVGGSRGLTRMESDFAEVLELPTES